MAKQREDYEKSKQTVELLTNQLDSARTVSNRVTNTISRCHYDNILNQSLTFSLTRNPKLQLREGVKKRAGQSCVFLFEYLYCCCLP